MENYAFLVAQKESFSKLDIKSILEVKNGLKVLVSLNNTEKGISILEHELPSYFVNAIDIVSAKDWILSKTKLRESFKKAVARLYLERLFRNLVKSASIKRGVLTYYAGLDKREVKLTTTKEQRNIDYSRLLASKALEDGYSIQEVKGSHFVITSSSGKRNSTTLSNCTCQEFDEHKDCLHLRIAQVISSERAHLEYIIK